MTSVAQTLLKPDPAAYAHSKRLEAVIKNKISDAGGMIPFAEFMQLALYQPGLGYYSAGKPKFGKDGDFITAPEISRLFSYTLAEQCAQILPNLPQANILEFGAGSGIMAADILLHLEKLGSLPECYYILEISADLVQRQLQTLTKQCPHLVQCVEWLTALPTQPISAIVLANEVLDAMPVDICVRTEEGLKQYYVADLFGEFIFSSDTIRNPTLKERAEKLHLQHEFDIGYPIEINLFLKPWLHSLSDSLLAGVVLLIDYGYPAAEYYHPKRTGGTLQCYYQHHVHNNFLILIGLQDITAHVDFTAVAEAAVDADFSVLGFTTQAMFLLNNHLLTLADEDVPDQVTSFNRHQQIKQLTLPTEMGETFKVISLGKNYSQKLQGFSQANKLHLL